MKKLVIVAVALVMVMGLAGGAFAASNSLQSGAMGISVGFDNSTGGIDDIITISGRYMIQNEMAAILGFGFEKQSGDLSGSYFGVSFGIRKYFKADDFAPFAEGKLTIISQDIQGDTDTLDLSANFGAEYFLHKQFSIEGSVGLHLGSVDDNAVPNGDYTYIGTQSVGVRANFYF